jgi:hypothetical protein
MSISRPFSQSSSNRSSAKPAFQKKIKPRIRGLSNLDSELNYSIELGKHNPINQTSEAFYSSHSERLIQ